MAASEDNHTSETPVTKLRDRTKKFLAAALDQLKVIPTDDNIPRDWRGVAHFAEVNTRLLAPSSKCLEGVLKQWLENRLAAGETPPTLKDLQDILGQIDRWDVYDDSEEMIRSDAEYYTKSLVQVQPALDKTFKPFENGCLTTDDVDRFRQGLPLIKYDAFLLYADEDLHYADVMIQKLEDDFKLRLVVKDRDLLSGVGLEFSATTKLIAERCSSLIVILSPHLLNSREKMFLLSFAHTVSLSQQNMDACKRIVPCRYEPCDLPMELSVLYCLNYRSAFSATFWPRLRNSIMAATDVQESPTSSRCVITEVTSQEISQSIRSQEIKPSAVAQIPELDTALVVLEDATTHFPGSSLENTPDASSKDPVGSSRKTSTKNSLNFKNFKKHLTKPFRKKEKEQMSKKKIMLAA